MSKPSGSDEPSFDRVDPRTLRDWLDDGQELALIDVRDGGPFSRAHLLLACNIPLAQLEVRAAVLLPRREVRIVLIDDVLAETGEALRAARWLLLQGYTQASVLMGGTTGWGEAGFELFSGTNVPSKAFGEHVEHACDTPRIDARTLRQWQQEGREILLVDSRPFDEFSAVSLPGAQDCPGAELVLRVPALLNSPQTTVVVNCAGRTRSIIGTQSLRNAGLPNPVYALKNGTMGWELAGLQVVRNATARAPLPDEDGLEYAQKMAADVAARFGVRFVDLPELRKLQADSSRTTHVFDVRQLDEFEAGHLPGSLNAPGGQLVQATDTFVATRGARIALIDQHEVQAVMTAHWLLQMGWRDVHVVRGALDGAATLETGSVSLPVLDEASLTAPLIDVGELDGATATIIDVGDSLSWRQSGIPGSYWAMRSMLKDCLAGRFAYDQALVFVCNDGRLSRFAAQDAVRLGWPKSCALKGGRAAWRPGDQTADRRPGATAQGKDCIDRMLCEPDDMWVPPYARPSGAHEAMQQYLTWELNLLEQLTREPYLRFS